MLSMSDISSQDQSMETGEASRSKQSRSVVVRLYDPLTVAYQASVGSSSKEQAGEWPHVFPSVGSIKLEQKMEGHDRAESTPIVNIPRGQCNDAATSNMES